MANLKFKGLISGSSAPRIVRLPIETDVDIEAGTVVFLTNDNKLTLSAENAKCIAGVVARDYKCTEDEFNPENGTGFIAVNVSGDSVYELALPVFTCAAGIDNNEFTIAESEFAGICDGACGGKLIATENGGFASDIKIGDEFTITEMKESSGTVTITLDRNYRIGEGDKFTFIPAFGFDKLCAKDGEIIFGDANDAKVICCDDAFKNAHIVLCGTYLA